MFFLINRIGASPQTYQCLTNKAVKYYMKESSAHIYNQRRRYDASKYNLHLLFWENTEIIIYMYLGFVKNYRFLIKKNWRVGKLRNDNNKAISHFAACVHHLVTTGHLGTTVHGYTPRCVVGGGGADRVHAVPVKTTCRSISYCDLYNTITSQLPG